MAVIYLDVDDEITSVASRLRRVTDAHVALVVPAGSRLGTSRINFRLLAREAAGTSRSLAIVTPDAAARAVATAAGLQAYGTVTEYEGAEAARRASSPATIAETAATAAAVTATAGVRAGGPARSAGTKPDGVTAQPAASGSSADAHATPGRDGSSAGGAAPVSGRASASGVPPSTGLPTARPMRLGPSQGRGSRRRWGVVLLVAVVVLAAGGSVAYTALPTATVTIRPTTEALGPVSVTVRADPAATAIDVAAAVVPATRVDVPVQVSDRLPATGKKVKETKATGSVTFLSKDPTRANAIPAGSVVRTAAGVAYATTSAVTVPKARIVGLTILPGTADAAVTAVKGGPEANVAPNTIAIVPAGEDPVLLEVRNRADTTGGTRVSTPLVTQKDVDAALKSLGSRLATRLVDAAADPARAPAGSVLVPGTESLGTPIPSPDPASLVGQQVDAFDLTLATTGAVTAYAPADVHAVALGQLAAAVPAGSSLVDGSATADVGDAMATGDAADVPATASGSTVRTIDPAVIRAAVRGRTPTEAEAALAAYGDVTVVVWPGFVPAVTGTDARIDVLVVPTASGTTPAPRSPLPSATPAPSIPAGSPSEAP